MSTSPSPPTPPRLVATQQAQDAAASRRPDWLTRHATGIGLLLGFVAVVTVLAALLIALYARSDALRVLAVVLGVAGVLKAVVGGLLIGEQR